GPWKHSLSSISTVPEAPSSLGMRLRFKATTDTSSSPSKGAAMSSMRTGHGSVRGKRSDCSFIESELGGVVETAKEANWSDCDLRNLRNRARRNPEQRPVNAQLATAAP